MANSAHSELVLSQFKYTRPLHHGNFSLWSRPPRLEPSIETSPFTGISPAREMPVKSIISVRLCSFGKSRRLSTFHVLSISFHSLIPALMPPVAALALRWRWRCDDDISARSKALPRGDISQSVKRPWNFKFQWQTRAMSLA